MLLVVTIVHHINVEDNI